MNRLRRALRRDGRCKAVGRTLTDVIEPHEEGHDGGLARPAVTHEDEEVAGRDGQRQPGQDGGLWARGVGPEPRASAMLGMDTGG